MVFKPREICNGQVFVLMGPILGICEQDMPSANYSFICTIRLKGECIHSQERQPYENGYLSPF